MTTKPDRAVVFVRIDNYSPDANAGTERIVLLNTETGAESSVDWDVLKAAARQEDEALAAHYLPCLIEAQAHAARLNAEVETQRADYERAVRQGAAGQAATRRAILALGGAHALAAR